MKFLLVSLVILSVQYKYISCECCGSNPLYQALHKCASAIANEPLSESCTDTQNSSDSKLDSLANQVEAILNAISSLQQNVSSNQESINQLSKSLQNITQKVDNVVAVVNNITAESNNNNTCNNNNSLVVDDPCGVGGKWMQMGFLDMTDPQEQCPTGFMLYEEDNVRACGRQTTQGGSCHSVVFPFNGNSYTEICGKVLGYQYTLPDAVWSGGGGGHDNIESHYVDGVSITRGTPRQHVWTFMAGRSESQNGGAHCPCNTDNNTPVQDFIGEDYYCESAVVVNDFTPKLWTHEQLWDGQDCHSNEIDCCTKENIPWFHKVLDSPATDSIELRVCADEGTSGEDSPVSFYAIYVK